MKCHYCNKEIHKHPSSVNRAVKMGLNLYCNRKCSGLGRRKEKSIDQKKADKAEYDRQYREKNSSKIREKKKAYEASERGRAMQKRNREKFKKFHLEYCRTPEYRAWKKKYDHSYKYKLAYGEFHEAAELLYKLEYEIDKRLTRQENNLHNKSQKRKRTWTSSLRQT